MPLPSGFRPAPGALGGRSGPGHRWVGSGGSGAPDTSSSFTAAAGPAASPARIDTSSSGNTALAQSLSQLAKALQQIGLHNQGGNQGGLLGLLTGNAQAVQQQVTALNAYTQALSKAGDTSKGLFSGGGLGGGLTDMLAARSLLGSGSAVTGSNWSMQQAQYRNAGGGVSNVSTVNLPPGTRGWNAQGQETTPPPSPPTPPSGGATGGRWSNFAGVVGAGAKLGLAGLAGGGAVIAAMAPGISQDLATTSILRRSGMDYSNVGLDTARQNLLDQQNRHGYGVTQTLGVAANVMPWTGTQGTAQVLGAARLMGIDPEQLGEQTATAASMGAVGGPNGMQAGAYALLANKAVGGQQALYMQSLTSLLAQGGMNLQDTSGKAATSTANLMAQLQTEGGALMNPGVAAQTISSVGQSVGNLNNNNGLGMLMAGGAMKSGESYSDFLLRQAQMSSADRAKEVSSYVTPMLGGMSKSMQALVESQVFTGGNNSIAQFAAINQASGQSTGPEATPAQVAGTAAGEQPSNRAETASQSLSGLEVAASNLSRSMQTLNGWIDQASGGLQNLIAGPGANPQGNFNPVAGDAAGAAIVGTAVAGAAANLGSKVAPAGAAAAGGAAATAIKSIPAKAVAAAKGAAGGVRQGGAKLAPAGAADAVEGVTKVLGKVAVPLAVAGSAIDVLTAGDTKDKVRAGLSDAGGALAAAGAATLAAPADVVTAGAASVVAGAGGFAAGKAATTAVLNRVLPADHGSAGAAGANATVVQKMQKLADGSYQDFVNRCEAFTEQMLTGGQGVSLPGLNGSAASAAAVTHASNFVRGSDPTQAPAGSDMIYTNPNDPTSAGHSAIALGGGRMGSVLSTGTPGYRNETTAQFRKDNPNLTYAGYEILPGSPLAKQGAGGAAGSGGSAIDRALAAAAQATGVPLSMLRAIGTAESGLSQSALSPAGAIGVMQLMPNTAKGLGVNPNDMASNVMGGARQYRSMLQLYGGDVDKALAAYNWGEGNLDADIKQYGNDWFAHAPAETRAYVPKVEGLAQAGGGPAGSAPAAPASIDLKVTVADPPGRPIAQTGQAVITNGGYWSGVQVIPRAG